jgi:beta-ribofuranosylaminobenzene 5'-phosphate synthase
MPAGPFHDRIRMIEEVTGPLPEFQTVLLLTDGSVTTLLEAISGSDVCVKTISQNVVPASGPVAALLEIGPGDPVNHRIVELVNCRTGEILIYAVSHTPLERLEPGFREDLMRADIPIGKILKKHHIESRREISDIRLVSPDPDLRRRFGAGPETPFLSRTYNIIRNDLPFMAIEELFPVAARFREPRIRVWAPSRLHLGLIDLHGGLGRVDGGIGITLETPDTVLEAERSPVCRVSGGDEGQIARVRKAAAAVLTHFGIPGSAAFTIIRTAPQHSGLGAGTALSLTVGKTVCELYGITVPIEELSRIVGRGGTSGIGTAAFSSGGLIIDGGHSFGIYGDKTDFRPSSASPGIRPPPVIARHPFPDEWQVLLVVPTIGDRVSGTGEQDIFRNACPVPQEEVQEICHEIVMQLLPGIVRHDLGLFAAAVNRIQETGFKKIEIARQTAVVRELLTGLRDAGAACTGMSSFGPAVYAITDSDPAGLERAAARILGETPHLTIRTKGNNTGASSTWL